VHHALCKAEGRIVPAILSGLMRNS
jgi:hypothetical protein